MSTRAMTFSRRCSPTSLHVLADKPWIIEAADFPRLQQTLDEADRRGVVAYDCMTQRFDIAYQLQRELVNDRAIFGGPVKGTADNPAVRMVSSHYLLFVTCQDIRFN